MKTAQAAIADGLTLSGSEGYTQIGEEAVALSPYQDKRVSPREEDRVIPSQGGTQTGGEGKRVLPSQDDTFLKNKALHPGQAAVLYAIIVAQRQGKSTLTRSEIAHAAKTTPRGVDKALAALEGKGFLSRKTVNIEGTRAHCGFRFDVTQAAQVALLLYGGLGSEGDTITGCHPSRGRGEEGDTPYYEEEDKYKKSSSSALTSLLRAALDDDPELAFWRDQGLDVGHIHQIQTKWPHKRTVEILDDLRHARWHIQEVGFKPDRSTPLAYLMGALIKTGSYCRIPSYKTPEELEIETLEKAMAEGKAKRQRVVELRTKLHAIATMPTDFDALYEEKGEPYQRMLTWIKLHDIYGHNYLQEMELGSSKHRQTMEGFFAKYISTVEHEEEA